MDAYQRTQELMEQIRVLLEEVRAEVIDDDPEINEKLRESKGED